MNIVAAKIPDTINWIFLHGKCLYYAISGEDIKKALTESNIPLFK